MSMKDDLAPASSAEDLIGSLPSEDVDEVVSCPLVPPDHKVVPEVSDMPPDQLLDGGSEDMELVSTTSE